MGRKESNQTNKTKQPLLSHFRFTPAFFFINVLSNNLQKKWIINYIIALTFCGHDSIISLILIHAPRLDSIKCLVSLQYEQYIVRRLDAYLV